jgi:hypothetical protein
MSTKARCSVSLYIRSVSVLEGGDHGQGETSYTLRLTTPAGYMVEGLDAQTLAFLLRVVG